MLALVLHPSASAAGERHYSIDVGAGAGVATNPFLTDPSRSGAYFDLRLDPHASYVSERSTTTIEGQSDLRRYLNGLGTSSSYGVIIHRSTRYSERLTLDGSLAFNSSKNDDRRLNSFFDGGQGGVPVGSSVDPIGVLLTPGQRRTLASAQLEASLRLNERDNASFGASADREIISNAPVPSNFWSFGTNAQFRRALSPSSSIGAELSVNRIEYDAGEGGYTVLKPQLIFSRQLSPSFNVTGSVGALIVNGSAFGRSRKLFSVSGNATGCRTGGVSSLCATISQDAGGSGVGGLRVGRQAYLSYSRKIGPDNRLTLNSGISHYGRGDLPGAGPSTQWQVGGGWERKVSNHLKTVADVGYRHALLGMRAATDLFARVGISLRVGDVK